MSAMTNLRRAALQSKVEDLVMYDFDIPAQERIQAMLISWLAQLNAFGQYVMDCTQQSFNNINVDPFIGEITVVQLGLSVLRLMKAKIPSNILLDYEEDIDMMEQSLDDARA